MLSLILRELRQIPFIRIIIPLILGILAQIHIDFIAAELMAGISILVLLILFKLFDLKSSYKLRYITGVFAYILLFTGGAFHTKLNTSQIPEFPKETVIVKATIIEALSEKPNSFQTVLKTQYYTEDSVAVPLRTQIIAYIQKDSVAEFSYGDEIIFKSRIAEVQNPGNPNEFDYKKYLLNRGITGQCYIEIEAIERLAQNKANPIIATGLNVRKTLSSIYRKYGIDGDEFAVLSALTLGDKSELEPETRDAYAKAGAMHILAVSGLHVGIIYLILNYIFGFLDRIKIKHYMPGRFLKTIVLLLGLWFFALLTGFSPSVMRAAVMFSFVVIGNSLRRRINIYNSLSASAFCLLLYDPYLITAVGFQLSYIAVISIVYLQPRLQNLISFKNNYLHKIWVLTTVSIAAQIGTTPISFLYFNLFPNWFFLSNLIVIPLATFIVYNAGLLLVVSLIPYISDLLAFTLRYLVKILNGSVNFIEQLPASATENIPFQLADTFFWYMIIISLLLFFQYKQARQLQFALLLLIIYGGVLTAQDFNQNKQLKMVVYNVRQSSLIQFIKGNEAVNIADTSLHNTRNYDFATKSYLLNIGVKETGFLNIDSLTQPPNNFYYQKEEFIFFGNKTIVLLNERDQSRFAADTAFHADCVILSGNKYFYIDDIKNLYNPGIVIFDSSNHLNRIERWKEECDTLGIAYHSVPEQGAFILDCR